MTKAAKATHDDGAQEQSHGKSRFRRRILMLGPGFIAAVAYLDPGNFATNITAGAQYGYLLVWVVVASNLMAMLVQYLAARIGVLTGRTLPELIADSSSRPMRLGFWLQAQVVAIATDLAEVVGGAVALQVLAGVPLVWGAVVTVVVSTVILMFQGGRRHRRFERLIVTMVILIAVGMGWCLVAARPDPLASIEGLAPRFEGGNSLMLAAGMLGATVMPHAIYLHSALVRDRFGRVTEQDTEHVLRSTRWDIVLSMMLAGSVNLAMVLLAAAALGGHHNTETLEGAHDALLHTLGAGPAWAFAVALLLAGLASTTVGSYSGSVIMNGLLRVDITPLISRLVTAVPAVLILAAGVDATRALVISQVVLSFGIPLVLVPLIRLSADPRVTGRKLSFPVSIAAWLSAGLIVALNLALLWQTIGLGIG
ncbi:MAG: Nramp family divalent metal transporter [Ancrocorticia sp.]